MACQACEARLISEKDASDVQQPLQGPVQWAAMAFSHSWPQQYTGTSFAREDTSGGAGGGGQLGGGGLSSGASQAATLSNGRHLRDTAILPPPAKSLEARHWARHAIGPFLHALGLMSRL